MYITFRMEFDNDIILGEVYTVQDMDKRSYIEAAIFYFFHNAMRKTVAYHRSGFIFMSHNGNAKVEGNRTGCYAGSQFGP